MRNPKRIPSLLLLSLLLTSTSPSFADTDPAQAVAKFYAAYQKTDHGGLPSPEARKALDPFLTNQLRSLLDGAAKVQADYAKRFPDEKPPFADGDLFCSLFEGFTTLEVGKVEKLPSGTASVEVRFTYSDSTDPKQVARWTDAVLVVTEEGQARVDDVEYRGDWPFAQKGKLSDSLRAVP